MIVRHLTISDLPEIERIFYANNESVERKNNLRGKKVMPKEKLSHLIPLWFNAMNKWYLNPEDKEHILLGLIEGDKLLAYVGLRFDLPGEFSDSWIVSWLKADPATNLIKNGGMKLLWSEMFGYAESVGKKRWHTITEKNRHRAFDAFGKKLVPEIDKRYTYYTLCEIPAGTRPPEDWIFEMKSSNVSFFPLDIRLNGKNIYNQVIGSPVKKSFIDKVISGDGLINFTGKLNKYEPEFDNIEPSKKLFSLFSFVTEEIVNNEIKIS